MKKRQDKVQEPHKQLSKRCRARILGISLSSCYKKPKKPDDGRITIMNEILDIYAQRPFQGYRRITLDLKDLGYNINHKRVYRLMRFMGLQAVYPKKNLSKRNYEHKVYPYLLNEHPPLKPHDVWCVDITYIKIANGFIYLTALIDVVSRYVVGWHVSNSLDTESCLMALEMAVSKGYRPKIINSDQGCQFTSQEWIYQLTLLGVKISMDGKGRALDNIPIERFWRTLKYEEVYLKTYETVKEARASLGDYIEWYNKKRRHSGINNYRPYEVISGVEKAEKWAFKKDETILENNSCGYMDNSMSYHTSPQTTATTGQTSKQIKQLKQETQTMNLSSKLAA